MKLAFVLLIKLNIIKHHFHRVCSDSHIIRCFHLDAKIKSIQTKIANNANLAGITTVLVDIRIQNCLDKLGKQFFKKKKKKAIEKGQGYTPTQK